MDGKHFGSRTYEHYARSMKLLLSIVLIVLLVLAAIMIFYAYGAGVGR